MKINTDVAKFDALLMPGLQRTLRDLCEKKVRSLVEPVIQELSQELFEKFEATIQTLDLFDGKPVAMQLFVDLKK